MALSAAATAAIGAGVQATAGAAASVGAGLFGKKKAYQYNKKLQEQQNEYNRQAQERAYEQNLELSKYAYDREMEQWQRENQANLDFWNMQNAYNSPEAQMQRYQSAGLNPNLIYNQENTASPISAASSPSMDTHPMQAEQMSGSSGVGDDLRMQLGDPIQEYYRVLQMEQSLENSRTQNKVLESQANLNNMNALFGETRNDMLLASKPYWASSASFDNLAKKISNDIASANLSSILYKNTNLLPLSEKKASLLNELLSQQLSFNKDMNPLKIKEISQRMNTMLAQEGLLSLQSETEYLKHRKMNLDFDFDKSLKEYVEKGDFGDNTFRRLFLYFLKGLAN